MTLYDPQAPELSQRAWTPQKETGPSWTRRISFPSPLRQKWRSQGASQARSRATRRGLKLIVSRVDKSGLPSRRGSHFEEERGAEGRSTVGACVLGEADGLGLAGVSGELAGDPPPVGDPHQLPHDVSPGADLEVQRQGDLGAGAGQDQTSSRAVERDLLSLEEHGHRPAALSGLVVLLHLHRIHGGIGILPS